MQDTKFILSAYNNLLNPQEKKHVKIKRKDVEELFKSEAKNVFDYQKANVADVFLQLEVSEKEIKNSLLSIAKKYAVLKEIRDAVEVGDIVNVRMESSIEKYNRNSVAISLGIGLFNKKLEDGLVGIKLNEVKDIDIGGNTVKVKLLSAERNIVPVVTDEMVAKERIESVNSIEAYRKYFIDNKISECIYENLEPKVEQVLDEIIDKSEFLIKDEDLEALRKETVEELRGEDDEGGKMTEAELFSKTRYKTLEGFKEDSIKGIKLMLVGAEIAKGEGFKCDQETYETYIKEWAEEEEITIEEVKRKYRLSEYLIFEYERYVSKKILDYFWNKIHVTVRNVM